jgi:hypothetical protein
VGSEKKPKQLSARLSGVTIEGPALKPTGSKTFLDKKDRVQNKMDATHFEAWSPYSTSVEFWDFGCGAMLPLRVVALSSTTDSLRKTRGSPPGVRE